MSRFMRDQFEIAAGAFVVLVLLAAILVPIFWAVEKYHNKPLREKYIADCRANGGEPHILQRDWICVGRRN